MSPVPIIDVFLNQRLLNQTPKQLLPQRDAIFLIPKLKINQ